MRPSSDSQDREPRAPAVLDQRLSAAVRAAGWSLRSGDEPVQFWIAKAAKRYPVLVRLAGCAPDSLHALLADAILRGRASSRGKLVAVRSAR